MDHFLAAHTKADLVNPKLGDLAWIPMNCPGYRTLKEIQLKEFI